MLYGQKQVEHSSKYLLSLKTESQTGFEASPLKSYTKKCATVRSEFKGGFHWTVKLSTEIRGVNTAGALDTVVSSSQKTVNPVLTVKSI